MISVYLNIFEALTMVQWFVLITFLVIYVIRFLYLFLFTARMIFKKEEKHTTGSSKKLSIVITLRNEEESLRKNLPAILELENIDYEVVVVDDFSQDTSLSVLGLLSQRYAHLKISTLSQETRYSVKLAQNIALKAASHNWVLITPHALNEVNEIEIQGARYEVQQLLDSVGRLTFTIDRLREFKTELRRLEAKNDSLKLKNNFLRYNNMLLAEKNDEAQAQIEELRKASTSIAEAEALQRQKILELNRELKTKSYLKLQGAEGSSFRLRGGRPIRTNKASTIEKLRGCVTIMADPTMINKEKVLYFQFLGPDMGVIEDNANTITVQGNVYSKKVELLFMGEETQVCDFITIPEGSLKSGNYTVNIFEDQRLLTSAEFQLK